jgi:hypothetical protein
MIDITKKHTTRNGLEVYLISDKGRGDYPIIGFIGDDKDVKTWTKEGVFHTGNAFNGLDLVEVKEKKVAYVNIYPTSIGGSNPSRSIADECSAHIRIACIRIEYEEGQFDE